MKMLRVLRLSGCSLNEVIRLLPGEAVGRVFSLGWRICIGGIAAALLLGAVTTHASTPPLPPLPEPFPETLSTDQFAVEVPPAVVVQASDEDTAWLAPVATSATAAASTPAATPDAGPPLEGPPTPLPPIERMSRGPADPAATLLDDGKPISLNLKNADLSAVLQTFAKFSGVNIVASEKIRGLVSLNLVDVPWRRAFDTLLDVHGLAMERHGEVIWVAPLSELAARERLRYEAHARAADLEPLGSRTFVLRYPRADDVRKLLTGSGSQRVLSKRGSVMADARTNLLFVTDLEARVTQIAELIAQIDRPTPQVMIEARIVEGDAGFSRNLGVKLSMTPTGDSTARGLVAGADGAVFDLSARPIGGFDAATAGLTLFAAQATRLLNIELSALENEGRGEIVSSPRVITADRVRAVVEQGTELPYQAKVGNGVSGVQFRRAALKLEVEPQITPHGHVILDLDVSKDSVGEQTAAGPAINTKHVQTRVEVEDGGTVAIGGIYSTDEREDVTRVPLLGKIPVLGWLFRHSARRNARSELVIFITPHIVPARL
ncbi:type II/III secretion system protein [Caballeronia udeis]|uniref:Type IV pilus biogenesis and competence protein PilQ n=1 Tax=Caballeronia udeis TaxID=1232866 RepID=A0A158J2S4_9BURK|nr:type IV pilus secretin PilQ [Caballeronia udeis]SAL63157.1 type II/III secretion system protein [Caballeronia udeis]